jgi:hypothetical protein
MMMQGKKINHKNHRAEYWHADDADFMDLRRFLPQSSISYTKVFCSTTNCFGTFGTTETFGAGGTTEARQHHFQFSIFNFQLKNKQYE